MEGKSNRHGQNGILRYEQPAYVKGAAFKNQSFETESLSRNLRESIARLNPHPRKLAHLREAVRPEVGAPEHTDCPQPRPRTITTGGMRVAIRAVHCPVVGLSARVTSKLLSD
jgi:hypothetical protein